LNLTIIIEYICILDSVEYQHNFEYFLMVLDVLFLRSCYFSTFFSFI
jgi:hypothetical protein